MAFDMAKRVCAAIADSTTDDLEHWAAVKGQSLSSLVSQLVEERLRQAKEKGEFPKREQEYSLTSEQRYAIKIFKEILEGKKPRGADIETAAPALDCEPQKIKELCDRLTKNVIT